MNTSKTLNRKNKGSMKVKENRRNEGRGGGRRGEEKVVIMEVDK
jgi:hypothetical protein